METTMTDFDPSTMVIDWVPEKRTSGLEEGTYAFKITSETRTHWDKSGLCCIKMEVRPLTNPRIKTSIHGDITLLYSQTMPWPGKNPERGPAKTLGLIEEFLAAIGEVEVPKYDKTTGTVTYMGETYTDALAKYKDGTVPTRNERDRLVTEIAKEWYTGKREFLGRVFVAKMEFETYEGKKMRKVIKPVAYTEDNIALCNTINY